MPHVDEGTLHAYLDGELPSAERKTLEAHLADCATCRAMLAEERALLERASALLGATQPADRPAPPFEQLGLPRSTRRSPWRVRTPVAWAASIALALGLGYYLRQPSTAPVSVTTEQHDDVALMQRASERADENKSAPATPSARSDGPVRTPAPPPAPRASASPAPPQAPPPPVARESAVVAEAVVKVAEPARIDSAADRAVAVDGVIIHQPGAASQTRNATPAPAQGYRAPDSVAASAAAGVMQITPRLMAVSRGPTTTSWPIISRGAARSLLGTDPVGVPGLARKIRRSPAADGTVVVEQQIDPTTTIQIFQRQTAAGYSDSSVKVEPQHLQERDLAQTGRLARYVGRLRIEIAGPLSVDSLNRLLDQVQPLP